MPLIDFTFWKQAPFLRLVLPLMAGIITAWELSLEVTFDTLISIFIFSGLLVVLAVVTRIRLINDGLRTVFLLIFLFLLGGFLTVYHDAGRHVDFAGKFLKSESKIILRIREPLSEKPASWKTVADIIRVESGKGSFETRGKAILYLRKTGSIPPLKYGDVIIARNNLQPVRNSGNPGSFDYRRYCHLQNIFYQAYLANDSWEKLSVRKANVLQEIFFRCRTKGIELLSHYIQGNRELGIAEALLVGYRDDLDKDLVQAYADTGVVHIIAISGLHLGLIYLILLFILKPLKDEGYQRWIKGILIILSLWSFAMITGGSPSALRACVMFSFIVTGQFFVRRQSNIYNTLAASAFLLLCFNPFLLFDVGFQLSYLAVLGIVMFQKPVYGLFISKNKVWNYFWKMMSVSIAAELLTFAAAIYYFHRFPLAFLIANLLVVPLASFILYAEVILMVVSVIQPLGILVGWVVMQSIVFMNGIIEILSTVSFSGFSGITFTLTETILLYVVIFSLMIFFIREIKFAFITFLFFFFLFGLSKTIRHMNNLFNKKVIVYNIPHYQALHLVDGRSVCFIGDSAVLENKNMMRNTFLPAAIYYQLQSDGRADKCLRQSHFIQFYNTRIFILDQQVVSKNLTKAYPVDYILISHHPDPDFEKIKNIFSPKMVVFDGSNPLWKIKLWKTACDSLHLHCFSVQEEGAWIANVF